MNKSYSHNFVFMNIIYNNIYFYEPFNYYFDFKIITVSLNY